MVINISKISLFTFIALSFSIIELNADEAVEKITFNNSKIDSKIQYEKSNRFLNENITLDVSRIIIPRNGAEIKTEFNQLNKKSFSIDQVKTLILEKGEFIEIIGIDKKRKLFNGTLLVRFNEIPDLEDFSNSYDLIPVKDLSDINVIGFKVNNILDTQIKLDQLKDDSNIVSIDLDLFDPTIKPR